MGSWSRARATQIPDCLGHNVGVPFTPAHGAAALPFRRLHLVFSGLLVGTFAPDFEYFLRLSPDGGFGHTVLGTFVLTLPLALLVLWLFHTFVKLPVARLLPDAIQRRLASHLDEFGFGVTGRILYPSPFGPIFRQCSQIPLGFRRGQVQVTKCGIGYMRV
jgi:hypothetical protein